MLPLLIPSFPGLSPPLFCPPSPKIGPYCFQTTLPPLSPSSTNLPVLAGTGLGSGPAELVQASVLAQPALKLVQTGLMDCTHCVCADSSRRSPLSDLGFFYILASKLGGGKGDCLLWPVCETRADKIYWVPSNLESTLTIAVIAITSAPFFCIFTFFPVDTFKVVWPELLDSILGSVFYPCPSLLQAKECKMLWIPSLCEEDPVSSWLKKVIVGLLLKKPHKWCVIICPLFVWSSTLFINKAPRPIGCVYFLSPYDIVLYIVYF